MNILTIGNGFVSNHLPYSKITERVALASGYIDLMLEQFKPDVLVNCIGKTGRPNIDWCESNQVVTAASNTVIPILLAQECAKRSIHLIQIGSGCIYFGESPNGYYNHPSNKPHNFVDTGWKETDFANPQSFYSKTKYACDLILGEMKHVTTLRIRMPLSTKNDSRNLINKLRGYRQIIDIPNSMTFMDDLSSCVDWVIKNSKTGTFNVVNPEPLTAVQVMQEYQKHVPQHTFDIIDESQLEKLTLAKRSNCILDGDKLKLSGFQMMPSKEALQKCMTSYVKNL